MLFNNSRESLRGGWLAALKKVQTGALLTALETQLADLIREHPEYHAWLERGDDALQAEFTSQSDRTNPFLHLSMHLALREQVSMNRPQGIARIHTTLSTRSDAHDTEHHMMEALGKALWEAQRAGRLPDERAYLEDLERLVTSALGRKDQ